MALIELNLEKPALKRVESAEKESPAETGEMTTEIGTEETSGGSKATDEMVETESDEAQQSGGSRIRRYGRRMALLGGTAAGVAAARKIRQRRKGSEQQELEEDWQTAE